MAFTFSPMSEQEAAAEKAKFSTWPDGEYDFEVSQAEETTSKASGNPMVKLTLHVFNDAGARRTVFDYLIGTEKAQFKVRGFAAAVGLIAAYESGEMNAYDMEGKTGRLKLGIQKDEQYGDKNTVRYYIEQKAPRRSIAQPAKREPATAGAAPNRARDLDDEIPF